MILLLVFASVIGLLLLASIWGMNVALGKLVGEKHRDLEQIVETGQVPAHWRRGYEQKMGRLAGDPRNAAQYAHLRRRAQQDYLKRLDRLTRYVHTATLIDGEDTRQLLLESLAKVRVAWEKSDRQAPSIEREP
ncbi:MAG: hypothetical protein ACUVX9_02805 [Anaerolineae bacterium]